MYRDALVKLLKDIDMSPTYAERIVAEYDKWSADCGDIYKTARELLDEG